jgi:hypothetical protein
MACRAAPLCVAAPALSRRLACAARVRLRPRGRVGRQRPRRRPQAAGSLRRARAVQQGPLAAPAHGRGRADEVCLAGRGADAAVDGAGAGAGVLGPGVEVGNGCDGRVDRGLADVRAHVARACEQSRYGGWQRGLGRAWGGRQWGRARWAAEPPAGQAVAWRRAGCRACGEGGQGGASRRRAASVPQMQALSCAQRTYGLRPGPIRAVCNRAARKAGLAPAGARSRGEPRARECVGERMGGCCG